MARAASSGGVRLLRLKQWMNLHEQTIGGLARTTGISENELRRLVRREVEPRGSTIKILLLYSGTLGGGLSLDALLPAKGEARVRHFLRLGGRRGKQG